MATCLWDYQNKILQDLLKGMRIATGLTQAELADLLNRPQSYVSKYESGERRLDITEVRNISICCGSSLTKFVNEFEDSLEKRTKI